MFTFETSTHFLTITSFKNLSDTLIRRKYIFLSADRNECNFNSTGCHINATCNNFHGGYQCVCDNGFYGNGSNCTGMYAKEC